MTGLRLDSWWDTSGVKVEKRGDVSPWPHGERTGIGATDGNPTLRLAVLVQLDSVRISLSQLLLSD